jgi:hypothetical protein
MEVLVFGKWRDLRGFNETALPQFFGKGRYQTKAKGEIDENQT